MLSRDKNYPQGSVAAVLLFPGPHVYFAYLNLVFLYFSAFLASYFNQSPVSRFVDFEIVLSSDIFGSVHLYSGKEKDMAIGLSRAIPTPC